jgi:hypothetical protein
MFWYKVLKERGYLEDLSVDGSACDVIMKIGFVWLRIRCSGRLL